LKLLTADEVASIIHTSRYQVYEYAKQGVLPSVAIGQRRILFSEEALQEFIRTGGSRGVATPEAEPRAPRKLATSGAR
jgi:excisionase family DNA binding protein